MYKKLTMRIFLVLTLSLFVSSDNNWNPIANKLLIAYPCSDSTDIMISYEKGLPFEHQLHYMIYILKEMEPSTIIKLEFDAPSTMKLDAYSDARIYTDEPHKFEIRLMTYKQSLAVYVEGQDVMPYLKSVIVDSKNICKKPFTGFLDPYNEQTEYHINYKINNENRSCGRRKVIHNELIVNGDATKPGDWPWHVALYRFEIEGIKYICGGTLISKSFVLTAAHCTTLHGNILSADILSVVLAKYNLIGGDLNSEEREVNRIFVHENFQKKTLENDISLIKLKSEAKFNDYIQPACLWNDDVAGKLPPRPLGTVVGWGFNQNITLSRRLKQASFPILSEMTCVRRNSLFYSMALASEKRFCAGAIGTSPCNGDSGGGFMVFVSDAADDSSGAWHVRGVVSASPSKLNTGKAVCDPEQYTAYTDVAKYRTWIDNYIKDDSF